MDNMLEGWILGREIDLEAHKFCCSYMNQAA